MSLKTWYNSADTTGGDVVKGSCGYKLNERSEKQIKNEPKFTEYAKLMWRTVALMKYGAFSSSLAKIEFNLIIREHQGKNIKKL